MTKSENISSITVGPRQSNLELLRIIAMFFILVVHSDFKSLGIPSMSDFYNYQVASTTRIIIQSLALVCVNIFILISGWFGIRPSIRGFSRLLFQILFFFVGIYLLQIIFFGVPINLNGLRACIFMTRSDDWFIKAYMGLYIISPVLNKFLANIEEEKLRWILINFYIFQTLYGCSGAAEYIRDGYSVFSFIGLYLLAGYFRRFGIKGHQKKIYNWGGCIWLISSMLNAVLFMTMYYAKVYLPVISYVNPLVVIGALGLFLYFSNMEIRYSKMINYISASSFAVYLIHCAPNILNMYYIPLMRRIFNAYNGLTCLLIMALSLVLIFMIAILIDQFRKILWNMVDKLLFHRAEIS